MTKEEKEAVLHCLRSMIDEELCEECPLYGTTGTDHCEKDCVRLAIEELEQEPKTGHWIEDAETYYKAINERGCEPYENTPIFLDDIACSECLAKFSVIDNETQRFKCCPNCGAKMQEVANDDKV